MAQKQGIDLGDSKYVPIRYLGRGTFGCVYQCKCYKCERVHDVCVKRIIIQNKLSLKMTLEEVYILSELKHPRIVQFHNSYVHEGTVNIVMEYMSKGTLKDVINTHSNPAVPAKQMWRYICDILVGLEYLHIRHIIHKDLKPANLLLDEKFRVKISDFGISKIHERGKINRDNAGTVLYMPPELLNGAKYDFKTDIWSVGIILYEMCHGRTPFAHAKNEEHIRSLIRQKIDLHTMAKLYGSTCAKMCQMMLIYEPQQRATIANILQLRSSMTLNFYHEYFDYQY